MKKTLTPAERLGIVIRDVRVSVNLSQEKLAIASDLHHCYIGVIERGKKNLTLSSIVRIANALGVKASDLLAEAGL